MATNQKVGSSSPPGRATFSFFFIYLQASIFSAHSSAEALSHANLTLRAPGRPCRWLAPCARVPGEPTQLINAFRLRATMAHGTFMKSEPAIFDEKVQ